MSNFKINPSKIITLEVAGTTYDSTKTSWHYNIQRLFNGTPDSDASNSDLTMFSTAKINSESGEITETTPLNVSDLNVNADKIQLYLDGEIPSEILKTHNNLYRPLKSAIDGLTGGMLKQLSGNAAAYADIATLALNAVSSVAGESGGTGFILDPWALKAPAWEGLSDSETPTFDYTFNFHMGQYKLWNAKEEVVKPIINLAVPTYLRKIGSLRTFGPFPTPGALLGNLLTKDIWKGLKGKGRGEEDSFFDELASVLETIVSGCYKDFLYNLSIGPLSFEWVTIKDSKVTWATETDQHGYPIAGSVKLTFNLPYGPALKYGSGVPKTVSMKFKSGSV